MPERLKEFERLTANILAGHGGDQDALNRLIAHFGLSYDPERMRRGDWHAARRVTRGRHE
jgi:hypothetical protein